MLIRTARYALQCNFGWPRPQPLRPEFDVLEHLSQQLPIRFETPTEHPGLGRVGLEVNGPGGGQWTLAVEEGRPVAAECGISDSQQASIYVSSRTWGQLSRGEATLEQAVERGELTVEGNLDLTIGHLLEVIGRALGVDQAVSIVRAGRAVEPVL
jgi:hypothetical protein